MLNLIEHLVNNFDIGKDRVRISLLVFGKQPKVVFNLNRYYTKSAILNAIRRAPKLSGATNTHLALADTQKSIFNIDNGMR